MKMKVLQNRGFATLVALMLVSMLTLIGLAVISTSDDEVTIAGNELQEARAFYAAEAGLEKVASTIQASYEATGQPPVTLPSGVLDLNNCDVTYEGIDNGPAAMGILSSGSLAGLNALIKSFTIQSEAVSRIDNSKVVLEQEFQTALVPIFQFAVFYGNDLEIAPGPTMNLIGRVHTNGNLYIQAGNLLQMESYVTAAGNIYHGRKGPGGVASGDVRIKDANGNYVSMKDGSGWLDANDPYWYDSSLARWGGRVQDAAHGQEPLNVPLSNLGDPHKLIERDNPDSYENKATLIIKDGVVMRKVGPNWVDVTTEFISKGVIQFTANKFMDQREGVWVDVTELDLQKLYAEGYGPQNGVIYFSDQTMGADFPALRLVNGSQLDTALTIASENPVYTLGDFNSVNKKPAALLADAVTFLSNSWDDAKSNLSKNNRIASTTTVNVSYLTGNVETTSSNYSGGFENLPRFLEKWTGVPFNWTGSAVNLWTSVQANSPWNGTYYSPPIRNWQYDTDLNDPANLPPETPVVRIYQRIGWRQQDVGYDAT